jgi:hypothetical protein
MFGYIMSDFSIRAFVRRSTAHCTVLSVIALCTVGTGVTRRANLPVPNNNDTNRQRHYLRGRQRCRVAGYDPSSAINRLRQTS